LLEEKILKETVEEMGLPPPMKIKAMPIL